MQTWAALAINGWWSRGPRMGSG